MQNEIDAGATRLDVRIERGLDGAVATSVGDDGTGMSRAVIEGPLLTLFDSSKESDSSKIGKYGIGFVSVFALAPDRVDVRTRTAAESWVVRLFGDHSFELEEGVRSSGTGTEVVLLHTMTVEDFAKHVLATKQGLFHWCKHAHLPITLSIVDGEGGGETLIVNTPLGVPGAAASVTIVEGASQFAVGVGDEAGPGEAAQPTFCGLYNRGLTLLETADAEPGLAWICFKIDSPHLAPTLSRDNVRRDREHRRLLKRVREIVAGPLLEELHHQLQRAAEEAASESCARYAILLEAALAPTLRPRTESVPVPLVDPVNGQRTMPLYAVERARSPIARKVVLVADASSPITLALAAAGRPVVRHLTLGPLLRRIASLPVLDAEQMCAFVAAVDVRGEDVALCAELARVLAAAGREIASVRLATFRGVLQGAEAGLLPWGSSAALFVNAGHRSPRAPSCAPRPHARRAAPGPRAAADKRAARQARRRPPPRRRGGARCGCLTAATALAPSSRAARSRSTRARPSPSCAITSSSISTSTDARSRASRSRSAPRGSTSRGTPTTWSLRSTAGRSRPPPWCAPATTCSPPRPRVPTARRCASSASP